MPALVLELRGNRRTVGLALACLACGNRDPVPAVLDEVCEYSSVYACWRCDDDSTLDQTMWACRFCVDSVKLAVTRARSPEGECYFFAEWYLPEGFEEDPACSLECRRNGFALSDRPLGGLVHMAIRRPVPRHAPELRMRHFGPR